MIRDFLQGIGLVPMPKDAVQIWDCDPLVVVNDDGTIEFARRCAVEFSPAAGPEGRAEAETSPEGRQLSLNVATRRDEATDLWLGVRSGFTLRGTNDEGAGLTWYVGGAADRYLTTLREHEKAPREAVPGYPED